MVFISEEYVVIKWLFFPQNINSQARHVFKNIKGVDILGYLLKWMVINKCSSIIMLLDFYEIYLTSQNSRT